MRRTGHTNCVKIDGPDRLMKTTTPTQKTTTQPTPSEFASERIKDRRFNLTAALVQRGLGTLVEILFEVSSFSWNFNFNQSKGGFLRNDEPRDEDGSRSDSPKSIESGSADSGLNEENPTKNWETTEQRMNTDPPVSKLLFTPDIYIIKPLISGLWTVQKRHLQFSQNLIQTPSGDFKQVS